MPHPNQENHRYYSYVNSSNQHDQVPKTSCPVRYVRYVYNRVMLENPIIRSAGVSTLSKLGAVCPALRQSIIVLLRRCILDEDDETRDRVRMAFTILQDAIVKCPWIPPSADDEEHVTIIHRLIMCITTMILPCF